MRFTKPWGSPGPLFRKAERWLLPGACLLCGETVSAAPDPTDPLICPICGQRFARLPEPQCPCCGQPLTPGVACRLCQNWPPEFGPVRSAVWLDDLARRTVHLLKYEGWWRLAESLAGVMARSIEWPGSATLVPIPLSPAREKSRGYNQSAVLAEALAQRLGFPVQAALQRRRDTGTQTALTPEARRANLAGAFAAKGPAPVNPVLVDDVFTTGATLAEAAAVLIRSGTSSVAAVSFARAVRPLAEAAAISSR